MLGIDNVVFLALACSNLPKEQRERAMRTFLTLNLFFSRSSSFFK